jgi:hypothetical protein
MGTEGTRGIPMEEHARVARAGGGVPVRRMVLAALVAFAASSCATLPPCPARGGPVWTEWTSPHVVLLTDLD